MKKPYLQLMIVALCTCAGPVSAQQANPSASVIPASVWIQNPSLLDSRLRGNDIGLRGNDETVGTLQGKLAVTPTGAATYSIPISVPPGTAGMTPKLSITYNSQNQNGTLGMGFSLEGLSAITRAPSNLAQNGQIHGVDFTDADRFSLAGQQLVAVKGTYGQDQTEYRTYIDSQSKIVSIGRSGNGPASFKVWTKGGQVAEYGATSDSALKAEVKKSNVTLLDGDTIKVWGLDKIQDTAGNYLTIHYTKTDDTGEIYPEEIDYTGNDAAGLKPYSKVNFIYEDRSDVRDLYHGGSLTKTQKRLKEITSSTLVNGQYQLVYDYKIAYEYSPNSQRSRITSIQECNGNGVCLKPTTFQWQTNEEGWEEAPQYKPPKSLTVGVKDTGVRLVDLNGNGLKDFVYAQGNDSGIWLNSGTGWQQTNQYSPLPVPIVDVEYNDNGVRFVDINGNGLPDFLVGVHGGDFLPTDDTDAWLNTKGTWVENSHFGSPAEFMHDKADAGARFVELNGDGLVDIVQSSQWYRDPIAQGSWMNKGSEWMSDGRYNMPVHVVENFGGANGQDNGVRFMDLNGNGLTDFVVSREDGASGAYINTGDGWQSDADFVPPTFITDNSFKDHGVRFADLNGDGLPDLMWATSLLINKGNTSSHQATTWINTGKGWLQDDRYKFPDAFSQSEMDAGTRLVDLNGDGFVDAVRSSWTNIGYVSSKGAWLNENGGWIQDDNYNLPAYISLRIGIDNNIDNGLRFIDLNGNGLPDILYSSQSMFSPTPPNAWLNKAKKLPDYLISVTDGVGEKTSIDYEPLSGTYVKVYDQEYKSDGSLDSQYPNPQFDGPIYVVYQTASDTALNDPQTKAKYRRNGIKLQAKAFPQSPYSTIPTDANGDQHITTYHYTGARTNKLGYGFLGFHHIQTTDDTTGITTVVTYSQDPDQHHVTQPDSSVTQQGNGKILNQTENTWDLKKIFGDGTVNQTVYFPYVTKTVKKKYNLNGDLLSTVTTNISLDNYANPVHTTITTEGNTGTYATDTKNTYENNLDKWFLGELTQTQVTRSAPNTANITRTSSFEYDSATGFLTKSVVDPSDTALMVQTGYKRDEFGNIKSTTISGNNFASRTNQVVYDNQGRFVIRSMNALDQVSVQTVDPRFGKPLTVTGSNNLSTTYQYDGWGRLIDVKNPDGTQQKTAYQWQSTAQHSSQLQSRFHRVLRKMGIGAVVGVGMNDQPIHAVYNVTTQKTDANDQPIGPVNTKYFDKLRRNVAKTTQGIDGTLIWSNTFYDELGRVVQQCQKHFDGDTVYSSRFDYDVLGRMTKTTNPDGSIIQVQYDGFKTTITNPLKQKNTKITNAIGKIIQAIDNEGLKTTYAYDAYGNVTSMLDSKGNALTVKYDKMGRKIAINDPDKGKWTYEYDALGNLLKQTNAQDCLITVQYDLLNRMISRTDNGNTSTWVYGTDPNEHDVGQLIKVTGVADAEGKSANALQRIQAERNGIADYTRTITYDNLARPSTTTVSVNGTTYTTKVIYDTDTGRPSQTTYGNGVRIQHIYNALGFLTDEKNASSQETYWHLNQMDAEGHITKFTRSNGLVTTKTYNPANGFLTDIETKPGTSLQLQQQIFPTTTHYLNNDHSRFGVNPEESGKGLKTRLAPRLRGDDGSAVQSLHYTYDALGNVQEKDNGVTQTKDTYTYDDLNRLTAWKQNNQTKRTYTYDELGNVTYKSDVGHYHYKDQAGPHAVTSITDDAGKTIGTMQYDADGNQISETLNGKTRTISYTSYGKPLQIKTQDADVTFYYNADRNRFIRIDDQPNVGTDTTVYLGNLQYITHKRGTTIEMESKLSVGGALIDIGHTSATVYELLTDHLGSMTGITDEQGNVVKRFSYTPFGEQIETAGSKDVESHQTEARGSKYLITHKGFTGHETLESVDLIHMNGRLYDPKLGRFLSADPEIQDPTNSQSLNRYTYCLNNPLAFVDPTGYGWLSDLWNDITGAIYDIFKDQFMQMAIGIALTTLAMANPALLGLSSQWLAGAFTSSAYSGATSLMNGGNISEMLRNMITTFATAAVWHGVGTMMGENPLSIATGHEASLPERIAVHGLVGGGLQVAEGGNFEDGFLSSAAIEATPLDSIGTDLKKPQVIAERTLAAGVVGGTVASVTGGHFANGAKTAAFSEMFSDFGTEIGADLSARTKAYFSNTYTSMNELEKKMPPNSVVFGIRPLDPLMGIEGDLDAFADDDLGLYHENVFVTDAAGHLSNYDFSPNGIHPDTDLPNNIYEYRFSRTYTNVAVNYADLHPIGFAGSDYRLMFNRNNCQVFSDTFRRDVGIPMWHG